MNTTRGTVVMLRYSSFSYSCRKFGKLYKNLGDISHPPQVVAPLSDSTGARRRFSERNIGQERDAAGLEICGGVRTGEWGESIPSAANMGSGRAPFEVPPAGSRAEPQPKINLAHFSPTRDF